ncbi:hypothetical protein GRJ2_000039700 [Grus japonensis]|uniref:Uncharacterized protein n=1 Tax=Grus japonensis TaxID=30415 RepID=A0ABC9VRB5_GRUJA
MLKGIAVIQRDLGSLEEWTSKNLLKIHKDTSKVLHLQRENPLQLYRFGTVWLESSFVEQDLEVLADRLKELYKAKQSPMLRFWVVKNHGMKIEDGGDRGRKLFSDSIGWTSPRSLFLTLDENGKPVSEVSSTMTGLI